ncbi:hypothetical protein ACIRD2_14945 [Streptomyces sp. NPDC093595]|uniref:hypothetical protein n=1 Tax=Streptomyces sp. NPDC093595 TaxID=3366045 RepID=UPI003827A921
MSNETGIGHGDPGPPIRSPLAAVPEEAEADGSAGADGVADAAPPDAPDPAAQPASSRPAATTGTRPRTPYRPVKTPPPRSIDRRTLPHPSRRLPW